MVEKKVIHTIILRKELYNQLVFKKMHRVMDFNQKLG